MILRLILASLLVLSGVSAAADELLQQAVAEEAGEGIPRPVRATMPRADAAWHGIEEIVVHARKRTESLEDTPISITALTGETLREAGTTAVLRR